MKTKNVAKLIAILTIVIGISFAGCKKNRTNEVTNPDTSSLQQLARDDAQVQASDDHITNDVNDILSQSNAKSIEDSIPNSCTISIDSIHHGDTIVYTLLYNGYSGLHNFLRTGTVVIERLKNVHWKDSGATVWVTYISLAITKISSGKSFIFSGNRTYENVSGGLIKELGHGAVSIKHQITGSLQITFEDGTTRNWTLRKTRTFSGTYPTQLEMTVGGFGSDGGYNNLIEWGANRKGENFYTQITTPILYSESCGWDPIWGVLIHQIPSVPKSAAITFGYNSSSQQVTQGSCADYFKLDWVIKTNHGTIYIKIP
jgi:hypothetical protein